MGKSAFWTRYDRLSATEQKPSLSHWERVKALRVAAAAARDIANDQRFRESRRRAEAQKAAEFDGLADALEGVRS